MRATCGRAPTGTSSEVVSAIDTSPNAEEALPTSASVAVRPCKAE